LFNNIAPIFNSDIDQLMKSQAAKRTLREDVARMLLDGSITAGYTSAAMVDDTENQDDNATRAFNELAEGSSGQETFDLPLTEQEKNNGLWP
jgi:hypothetical protein